MIFFTIVGMLPNIKDSGRIHEAREEGGVWE